MAERPLLLFPGHEVASRSNLGGGGGKFRKPTHARQVERIAPYLQQLQTTLNNRTLAIQDSSSGIEPELALVIETVGGVEGFLSAVKKINGLEWLGETEKDDIIPDDDFFDEKESSKLLSGRLFFLFTNQQALTQLKNLWDEYKNNPSRKFSEIFEHGLASLGRLFEQIKDIRYWDVQDRLSETGVIQEWKESLRHDGSQPIKFEAELWFRSSNVKREEKRRHIETLVTGLGGQVLSQCVIDEITYHALLAELPANEIQNIINNPTTELVSCDGIMFFRPVGQMLAGDRPTEGNYEELPTDEKPLPSGNPVIAVLDGLPLENHHLLAGRLRIDDPDGFASGYGAADRVHGTAMASLVVHGDLDDAVEPLPTPIYVRPIMRPEETLSGNIELVPIDVLVVDLIHRAIKRLFDGDGDEEAIAPTVKMLEFSALFTL